MIGFPAQTAAVFDGLRMVPDGIWKVIGRRQPLFREIGSLMRERRTYIVADFVIAEGALKQ